MKAIIIIVVIGACIFTALKAGFKVSSKYVDKKVNDYFKDDSSKDKYK